jgi:hypothetical protein
VCKNDNFVQYNSQYNIIHNGSNLTTTIDVVGCINNVRNTNLNLRGKQREEATECKQLTLLFSPITLVPHFQQRYLVVSRVVAAKNIILRIPWPMRTIAGWLGGFLFSIAGRVVLFSMSWRVFSQDSFPVLRTVSTAHRFVAKFIPVKQSRTKNLTKSERLDNNLSTM